MAFAIATIVIMLCVIVTLSIYLVRERKAHMIEIDKLEADVMNANMHDRTLFDLEDEMIVCGVSMRRADRLADDFRELLDFKLAARDLFKCYTFNLGLRKQISEDSKKHEYDELKMLKAAPGWLDIREDTLYHIITELEKQVADPAELTALENSAKEQLRIAEGLIGELVQHGLRPKVALLESSD